MSEEANTENNQSIELEAGTYEIIRKRLQNNGEELRSRLGNLNTARKDVFGAIENKLIATERITTENNCIPRDMVDFGDDLFLFGYNVHIGLKSTTSVSDVFSLYQFKDEVFHQKSLEMLQDKQFLEDFDNLYKYYRNTRLAKMAILGPHLFMVFQVGKSVNDIKTFKWLVKDNELQYLDNRSDHEFKYPDQHEFKWTRTKREAHREGQHPHISIEDLVFVETIGGDLTIKIEDNTTNGKGIYSEPVQEPDQTLDDAEIYYAVIGNLVVLKIRPYQENDYRYIVFNAKIKEALRVDALEDSCVLLPDDHGVIFAKGYYIQTGEFKLFDNQLENMLFEKRIASPNGEDYLYVFYNKDSGIYSLLSYNLISQGIATPIICHGYVIFDNGELCYFKSENEQQKHHTIQIWQTPYLDHNITSPVNNDSFLFKIGNKDIVRGMAECQEVLKLINKEDSYANLYVDLVKTVGDILDSYYWLKDDAAMKLSEPLTEIKASASSAISEFEKVVQIRISTTAETERVTALINETFRVIKRDKPKHINDFVKFLADLRSMRGEVISLKDLRYVDFELIEGFETELEETTDRLSQKCVEFLLEESALQPYEERVTGLLANVAELKKVVEANALEEEVSSVAGELEMLIDIVSNLKIEDATQTTRIIDNISTVYSNFNTISVKLKNKRKELLGNEGKAEFNAQIKLIGQSLVNFLEVSDSPEKCEEYLNKLMVQLEELEGKFAEFDEFLDQLTEKREEIYNAFESRKIQLVEERNRKAQQLLQSAERILKGIANRVSGFSEASEINGYFASDIMVDKVRTTIEKLIALGDTVKADDVQSRLKTVKEDALRQLKDRNELFVDGENIIRLGKHNFMVNTQELDLTLVQHHDKMCFHLTGTNFFDPIDADAFDENAEYWGQAIVSENRDVYRAEYLAWLLLKSNAVTLTDTDAVMLKKVQTFMVQRYTESYTKGVHDKDAMIILKALLHLEEEAGLLMYSQDSRVLAQLFWGRMNSAAKELWKKKLNSVGLILEAFPDSTETQDVISSIRHEIDAFNTEHFNYNQIVVDDAAEYLFYEQSQNSHFIAAGEAVFLKEAFEKYLKEKDLSKRYHQSIEHLDDDQQFNMAAKWVHAYSVSDPQFNGSAYVQEAACLLLSKANEHHALHVSTAIELEGFIGSHSIVDGGKMHLNYAEFSNKMKHFESVTVPAYASFVAAKKQLIDDYRSELRLDEFKPRVLSAFVRNRLIDEVYLPVIGNNLAKQMGTAGENKRTDLMGLLLLISPPGYGKTTLMEYIASRLGLVFVKVNGPALGHEVTSLDPSQAPNAGAAEELEKLNLALEMGDNIMLYLDDIQHCNPEFLQKFISLCDAQRKIEGVYKGRSKTYDLRGRKVCVVMAGNPYTESGEKFRIPDMLANRADIYNLGDIIGDNAPSFKLSYVENSMTSNSILGRLGGKSRKDALSFVGVAEGGDKENLDLEASYSAEEVKEYVGLLQRALQVRDIILKVNMEYIASAGQADEYRTEPPFKLQGSYRDMNKIVEKLNPIMNDEELQTLILSHYQSESQTLTTGAESNLLKFKSIFGVRTSEEDARWDAIITEFQRLQKINSGGSQHIGRILEQMEAISSGLHNIGASLSGRIDTNNDEE